MMIWYSQRLYFLPLGISNHYINKASNGKYLHYTNLIKMICICSYDVNKHCSKKILFVLAQEELLTYPHPLQSAGTIVEASFCRNSINISRSVIWVWSCSTNWLFILSGLTIWPTAESTWALSSSSLNLSMLSTFKFRRALSCSIKRIRRFVKRLLYFVLSRFV